LKYADTTYQEFNKDPKPNRHPKASWQGTSKNYSQQVHLLMPVSPDYNQGIQCGSSKKRKANQQVDLLMPGKP
jgi:hypothetical protein